MAARRQADGRLLQGHAAGGGGALQRSLETPYKDLPEDFKRVLLRGSGETEIEFNFWRAGKMSKVTRPFEGVIPNLERLYHESESEFTRNRLKAFMSPQFCDACHGRRLKPEILAVTLGRCGAEVRGPCSVVRRNDALRRRSETPKLQTQRRRLTYVPGLSIMDVCALSVERGR